MTTPTLRAIPCSERMPTREDADVAGDVLWMRDAKFLMAPWAMLIGHDNKWRTYFFPLNRSAIATDAEEQRGEGGE